MTKRIVDPRVIKARTVVLHARSNVRTMEGQIARLKYELAVARMTIRNQEDRAAELQQMLVYHDAAWRELARTDG